MKKGKRNIFAICDLEVDYAYNFMEYLTRRNNIPFEVQAFTSPEILCDFAAKNDISILLISDKAVTPAVRALPVEKLIILSEGVHNPDLDQYPSVYKYQASDSVVREVMDCYSAQRQTENSFALPGRQAKVIGVYSPVGRARKTSFALALGQILARDRPVLYLNLESYSGFEQMLGENCDRNIGDLLYYLRQDQANLIHRMNGMIRSFQNLDYIPPVSSPMDILCTSGEDWLSLFRAIAQESGYDYLILDLGDAIQDLYEILNFCRRIYMPVRSDPLSQAKISQFENLIHIWDYKNVEEKLKKITLPYFESRSRGRAYFEDLVWGELGDYVKELLREEKEESQAGAEI